MIIKTKDEQRIKEFIRKIQVLKLEKIIDVVIEDSQITRDDLMERTKRPIICDARKKIIYISKIKFNISNNVLVDVLGLSAEWISMSQNQTHDALVDNLKLRIEINKLMNKICY